MSLIKAERAVTFLTHRDWQIVGGYWRPTIATVEANPAITPGNYTTAEALAVYNFELEDD